MHEYPPPTLFYISVEPCKRSFMDGDLHNVLKYMQMKCMAVLRVARLLGAYCTRALSVTSN
jgi:hypothetical protein